MDVDLEVSAEAAIEVDLELQASWAANIGKLEVAYYRKTTAA